MGWRRPEATRVHGDRKQDGFETLLCQTFDPYARKNRTWVGSLDDLRSASFYFTV